MSYYQTYPAYYYGHPAIPATPATPTPPSYPYVTPGHHVPIDVFANQPPPLHSFSTPPPPFLHHAQAFTTHPSYGQPSHGLNGLSLEEEELSAYSRLQAIQDRRKAIAAARAHEEAAIQAHRAKSREEHKRRERALAQAARTRREQAELRQIMESLQKEELELKALKEERERLTRSLTSGVSEPVTSRKCGKARHNGVNDILGALLGINIGSPELESDSLDESHATPRQSAPIALVYPSQVPHTDTRRDIARPCQSAPFNRLVDQAKAETTSNPTARSSGTSMGFLGHLLDHLATQPSQSREQADTKDLERYLSRLGLVPELKENESQQAPAHEECESQNGVSSLLSVSRYDLDPRSQCNKSEAKQQQDSLVDLLSQLGVAFVGKPISSATDSKPMTSSARPSCTSQPIPTSSQSPSKATSKTQPNPQSFLHQNLNRVLGPLVGLNIEPLQSGEPSPSADAATSGRNVPEGLNELLSQFGLQFYPEESSKQPETAPSTVPESSTSPNPSDPRPRDDTTASSSAPRPPQSSVPHTSAEVNPLARFLEELVASGNLSCQDAEDDKSKGYDSQRCDVLCGRNFEKKDEKPSVQIKGKGAAFNGKNPIAPSVSQSEAEETSGSSKSRDVLDHIEHQLAALQSSFTFPDRLSFARSTPGSHPPPLLFNRVNSAYHAQTNALLQLLLEADSINSGGKKEVRQRRKELVRKVEQELAKLEELRDARWEKVKEKRSKGEESEPESGKAWSDDEEIQEKVEEPITQESVPADSEKVSQADDHTKQEVGSPQSTINDEHHTYAEVVRHAVQTEVSSPNASQLPTSAFNLETPDDEKPSSSETHNPASDDHRHQDEDHPSYTVELELERQSEGQQASSPVHHPVTVEDAEDEEGAKSEGYELV